MNFKFHFGELHSNNSINDKNNLFENYIPKCYKVKRILISFNCFSEYTYYDSKLTYFMYMYLKTLSMLAADPDVCLNIC